MGIKKLNVFVVKMETNCGACIEEVNGFVITRKNLKKIEKDLPEALELHFEGLHEYEREPWMNCEKEFAWHYDLGSFLEKYNGIFNQTNLAKVVGINDSLMRQYLSGVKKPGKKQIARINEKLHDFIENLSKIHIL